MFPNLKLFQVFFSEEGREKLFYEALPYNNEHRKDKIFENAVILDVWENKREIWENADYVGVVSWRFKEKTGLNYFDIVSNMEDKDVYLFTPAAFMASVSPYSRSRAGINAIEIAKIADKQHLFPFDLYDYDNKYGNDKVVSFCNYFAIRPHLFDDYCRNYLKKAVDWISKPNRELKKALKVTFDYRGKQYPIDTFFLEGLFQCYVHYKGLSFEYIPKHLMKEEDDHFGEILMNICRRQEKQVA